MPIVSFWNESIKENGQTSSILAMATHMAIEHNFRILVIDATFNDSTMFDAFWKQKENKTLQQLTKGKLDISGGAEGLVSAIASNKATPEIITNYTRIVFKNRLDILLGLRTEVAENQEKSLMLYKDLILAANKYYDMVLVDLNKGYTRPSTKILLEKSDVIVYVVPPNMKNIQNYIKLRTKDPIVKSNKIIPLLAKSDESSTYNVKNVSKFIKEKVTIPTIPYNVRFLEAVNEANCANFFIKTKVSTSATNVNGNFISEVDRASKALIDKIKSLNK